MTNSTEERLRRTLREVGDRLEDSGLALPTPTGAPAREVRSRPSRRMAWAAAALLVVAGGLGTATVLDGGRASDVPVVAREPETPDEAEKPGVPPQPTPADRQLVADLTRFLQAPSKTSLARVPFADDVRLGLGDTLHVTRRRSELVDPEAWSIDVELFHVWAGPFSALEVVRDLDGDDETVVSLGDYGRCGAAATPPPPQVAHLRRVSMQPAEEALESCLQWFSVDLFVDGDGEVAAITLDLSNG